MGYTGFFLPFQFLGFSDNPLKFNPADIENRDKVLLHRNSFMWAMRRSSSARVPMSRRYRTAPLTPDAACSAFRSASSSVFPKPTYASARDVWVTSEPDAFFSVLA